MSTQTRAPSFSHKSPPNAAKLIDSMRHLGYDNYVALADLVDNCIDANARNIKVIVRIRDKEPEIIIADDGIGMSHEILDQAIRLGSMIEKESTSDLGRFGMGLCTASLSICRQTTVLTKSQDGKLLKAINDVDEIKRQNDFVSLFEDATPEDSNLFTEFLPDKKSGTVIVLKKCDNFINKKNPAQFANILKNKFARIFRYFLSADREIEVNGSAITAYDPLMWNNPLTEKFDDGELKIAINDGEFEVEDTIRIKLAILPENEALGDKESAGNIKTQGFYILRNNREILDAVSLDLFTKHNSFNRFRGEIQFSGKLDKYIGVNFTKRNIAPWQSLSDQLDQYLRGQILTIRKRLDRAKARETSEDVRKIHDDVVNEIRKKSKLLVLPEADKEKRASPEEKSGDTKQLSNPTDKIRQPGEKKQQGGIAIDCEFQTVSMTEAGPIYEAEKQGRKIIIQWNSDHAFYKRFLLDKSETAAEIDFLIYSWACAELKWFNDEDSKELITNLKSVVSANMRTLLS